MQAAHGKKLVNTKGGFRIVSVEEHLRSPFELQEPKWQCDTEHSVCGICCIKFSVTVRRHHCRRCGKIFCADCCSEKIILPRLAYIDPQRVCSQCIAVAKKEKEFYEKHICSLENGAEMMVDDSAPLIFHCKLNPKTHRDILFDCASEGHTAAHDAVLLADVISMQCLTDTDEQLPDGLSKVRGIILKYKKADCIEEVKLQIQEGLSNEKEPIIFIAVLQEAMKMLFDVN